MMGGEDPTHNRGMSFTGFGVLSHFISLTDGSEWPSNNARYTGNW